MLLVLTGLLLLEDTARAQERSDAVPSLETVFTLPMPGDNMLSLSSNTSPRLLGGVFDCRTKEMCILTGAVHIATGLGGIVVGAWFVSLPDVNEKQHPVDYTLSAMEQMLDAVGIVIIACGAIGIARGIFLIRRGLRMGRAELSMETRGPTGLSLSVQF